MKPRALLFAALTLPVAILVPACTTDAPPSDCGTWASDPDVTRAVQGVVNSVTDAIHNFYGCTLPGSAGTSGTRVSVCFENEPCNTIDVCQAAAGDTDCNACVKGSCCAEAAAWLADPTAKCLVGCAMTGTSVATCSDPGRCNGAPDPAYDDLTSCISDHCASACAELRLP